MFVPCCIPPCLNLIPFHQLHPCSAHPSFHRHRKSHRASRHLSRLSRHTAVQLSHVHQPRLTISALPELQRDLQRAQSRAQIAHLSRQLMPASMASISMSTGSLTKTTTTTRRSTDSPFHAPSGRRRSLRSWTLKDVILYHFPSLRCSTNRPTTIGFGSWRQAEKCA